MKKKSILDSISGIEALQVLKALCASDAGLRKRIESEAEKLLRAVDPEDVASDVLFELEGIDVEDLWNRSGPSRHGYSSPDEMAMEMIEEALRPFEDKIEEYDRIGMPEQSMLYCMGVLKGIYQFEHETQTEFREWAVDIPGDCFGAILDAWQKGHTGEHDVEKMNAFLSRECPEWAE